MKSKVCFFLLLSGVLFMVTNCTSKRTAIGTITDIDGNQYQTVIIGEQEWMKENLKTTRFNDGTIIPFVHDVTEWRHIDAPAYVWPDNDIYHKDTYGALYNWWAVGDRNDLCPAGWRVSTEDDWKTLESYLGMTPEDIEDTAMRGTGEGGKLKAEGTQHWDSPNEGATDEYGFSALPAGRRESDGTFLNLNRGATFWLSTETSFSTAYYRHFPAGSAQIGRNPNGEKKFGLSVRCIKE